MKEHQRRTTKKKKKKLNLMREMLQRENLLPNDSISTICNQSTTIQQPLSMFFLCQNIYMLSVDLCLLGLKAKLTRSTWLILLGGLVFGLERQITMSLWLQEEIKMTQIMHCEQLNSIPSSILGTDPCYSTISASTKVM